MWDKSKSKGEVKRINVASADATNDFSRQEWRNNIYRIICLSAIGLVLIGGGIALILTGTSNDIEDLIIIGAIFLGAGVVFIILIFTAVTRPSISRKRNRVNSEIQDEPNAADVLTNQDYVNSKALKIEEPEVVIRKHRPSEFHLYGYYGNEKLKIHLPEPEVASGEIQPIPMVVFPNDVNSVERSDEHVTSVTLRESTNLENV